MDWMERAQTAEAQLATMRQGHEAAVNRVREFKTNFGVREDSNGAIHIDFDKLVGALGVESALELRGIIDETYKISGAAGEKPKIKVVA